jgi:hypothetical protein
MTIQQFEGSGLFDYPTAKIDSDGTVRLEVPTQWYSLEDLKGYIKFLKGIKQQLKEQNK